MIAGYVPVRLIAYGVIAVIAGIVVVINKARAAVAKVDTSAFVPELTTIRRDFVPAMPSPIETIATAVRQMNNVRIEQVTNAVYVALNAAGGLFVRITPTQVAGGTKLVVEGRRKVKVEGLGKADDAMLAFETSLRRQLAAMGFSLGTLPAAAAAAPAPAAPAVAPAVAPAPAAPLAPPLAPVAPAPPAAVLAPPVVATPALLTIELQFDDRTTRRVATGAVIGRGPVARAEDAGLELVTLDDPTMSVSKTHLALGIDAAGVWVEDRNSTNGVSVVEPDGSSLKVLVGRRVRVMRGSRINFGDRWLTVG